MPPSATSHIRVLIIDDHTVVRTGLRMLIESHPGLMVAGEAKNRRDALAVAAQEHPDIILLDLNLSGESGLDIISELLTTAEGARILVLTGVRDLEAHQQAVRLGAMGVVLKDQPAEVLLKAIKKVHAGEVWIDRVMMASLLSDLSRGWATPTADPEAAKLATLTEREREVIHLVSEGLKNKRIAERLFISETTIRHHLTSIFSKLGVADRLELVIYAYRYSLAKPLR